MDKLLDEFKEIIGEQELRSFLTLLKEIGPDARTHRILVCICSGGFYHFHAFTRPPLMPRAMHHSDRVASIDFTLKHFNTTCLFAYKL